MFGAVSYEGRTFEVPYELSGQQVVFVVDPLGAATAPDVLANSRRRRSEPPVEPATATPAPGPNLIELPHRHHYRRED